MYILGRYVRVVNVGWEGDAMTRRDVNKGSGQLEVLPWLGGNGGLQESV